MPLPENSRNLAWPPEEWRDVYRDMTLYAAWYSGDINRLSDTYESMSFVPSLRGAFWAKKTGEERRVCLHVPLAGDMAATNAALLFGNKPTITIPQARAEDATEADKAAQARLDEILLHGGVYNSISEAAEIAAAFGGVYLKVNWRPDLVDYPILSVAHPDNAIPEFDEGKPGDKAQRRRLPCAVAAYNTGQLAFRYLQCEAFDNVGRIFFIPEPDILHFNGRLCGIAAFVGIRPGRRYSFYVFIYTILC
jgi:hypothetical protein